MNLWLRYQAWRHGICYKHKKIKETINTEMGIVSWCNKCNLDKIEEKQHKSYIYADVQNRIAHALGRLERVRKK